MGASPFFFNEMMEACAKGECCHSASVLSMIERGATHIGVATDHGVPQELLSQFPILEEALEAIGVIVWPMVHYEADDALASAAGKASQDGSVKQVIICTPDKDLSALSARESFKWTDGATFCAMKRGL